jgi:intergrase/recombinase
VARRTARNYINYLTKYISDVQIQDIEDIQDITDNISSGRNAFSKAMRSYLNFLVDTKRMSKERAEDWKEAMPLTKDDTDTWVPSIEQIKSTRDSCRDGVYTSMFKLLLYSGIRISEAYHIISTFDEKRLHIVGDIAYYDLDWNRGSKKSNKAFIPSDFISGIRHRSSDIPSLDAIKTHFQRQELPLKYCRKFFINACYDVDIRQEYVQYMVGHIGGSVLVTNYLEKLSRSITAYKKVVPILKDILET